jgi:hypothetical protein
VDLDAVELRFVMGKFLWTPHRHSFSPICRMLDAVFV